jgi:hypothetical protein
MIKAIMMMLKGKKSPLIIINDKASGKAMSRQLGGNYCQD